MKTKINPWLIAITLLCVKVAAAQNISENVFTNNEEFQKDNDLKLELVQANQAVAEQRLRIVNLEKELEDSKTQIESRKNADETVSLYGVNTVKSLPETAISILLGLLFVSLIVFTFRFRSANFIAAKATEALTNLEQEFEEHVRNSLERDQKLRRQLQDEINRHKIARAS